MPDPVDCCFSNIFDIALVFTANSDHYEFTCANKYKSALGLDLGKTLVSFSAACKLPQFGLYKLAPLLTFYLECTAVSKLLELLRTLLLASYNPILPCSYYFMYFFMNCRMLLQVIVPVFEERTLLP